jgi:hypothetical protein
MRRNQEFAGFPDPNADTRADGDSHARIWFAGAEPFAQPHSYAEPESFADADSYSCGDLWGTALTARLLGDRRKPYFRAGAEPNALAGIHGHAIRVFQ